MPDVRLDHISYAAGPEGVGAAAQRLGAALGAGFRDGGMHPGFGTRNFVCPLAGGVYLEVVGALEHPASDKAPFGQAVRQRTAAGGGWLAWVIAVDDITTVEARLGRQAVAGHRRRPDGVELNWRQVGVLDVMDDPALPFFIEWAGAPEDHPSAGGSAVPSLDQVEICGDEDKIADWLAIPLDHHVNVRWVEDEDPGVVAVRFSTARGPVRID